MTRIKKFFLSDKVYLTELLFKIVYILHLRACFNPYIENTPIVKVTLVCTMALGGLLLFCKVLTFRSYCRTPGLAILILFVSVIDYIAMSIINSTKETKPKWIKVFIWIVSALMIVTATASAIYFIVELISCFYIC